MKPEAQRIAIAEACGWWVELRDNGQIKWSVLISPDKERVDSTSGVATLANFGCVPDYLNDLNAMHEAEKTLMAEQKTEHLRHLTQLDHYGRFATAAQRAEAFLRALKLWNPNPTHPHA